MKIEQRQSSILLLTILALLSAVFAMMIRGVSAETTATFPVIADFEGGVPADWFVYGDWGGGVTIDASPISANLPAQVGANELLSATVNVPSWGGFGAGLNPVQDWSDYDAISFWFYGENSKTMHEFEIQTAAGDDRRATFEDSFAGWRQIILPFSTFGAGGAYDLSAVDNWVFVLDGTVGSFQMDDLQLVNLRPFADFEGGMPAGWFVYGDWGNGITIEANNATLVESDPSAVPGQMGDNGILSATVNVSSWGGLGAGFMPTQDWSEMQGISFWFYGENLATAHEFEIQTAAGDDRRAIFVDDFSGWRLITLPFSSFGTTPYDLSAVDNWVFVLDGTVGSFKIDALGVYGDMGNVTLKVGFDSAEYNVMEGGSTTITLALNAVSAETITVTYATSDGTAMAGDDYATTTGNLVFAPGTTMQSFTVATVDNNANDDERTVLLTLSNPFNAEIGMPNPATLIIGDDEMASPSGKNVVIENYESAISTPSGTDSDGNPVGYEFFAGGASTVSISKTITPPVPVPGSADGNTVLQEELYITSGSYSGFAYKFTNDAMDAWVPVDWSSYAGISFWLYGNNTGGVIFIDVIDNRKPDSKVDDAERWSLDIADDFTGWQYFEFTWADFNRKDVGNGAPNDGFNLTEIHGYAFGGFGSQPIDHTYYIDDVSLMQRVTVVDDFEGGVLSSGTDANGVAIGYLAVSGGGATIATSITSSVPAPLPNSAVDNQQLAAEMSLPAGSWAVAINAFANDTADQWITEDWSSYEGVCFWLYGNNTGGTLFVDIIDNRNSATADDAERYSIDIPDNFAGWQFFQFRWDQFNRKDIGNGAPNDGLTLTTVHGYAMGGFGSVDMGTHTYYLDNFSVWGKSGLDTPLTVQFETGNYQVTEGSDAVISVTLNMTATMPVTVTYRSAEAIAIPDRDFTPVMGQLVIPAGATTATFVVQTMQEMKADGDKNLMLVLHSAENAEMGFRRQAVLAIMDDDTADPMLLDDFEGYHPFQTSGNITLSVTEIMSGAVNAIPGQQGYEQLLEMNYDSLNGAATFDRTYVEPQDWSTSDGMKFKFYGSNSGETHTVKLYDNQSATTADTPASEWVMVWSDEFNDPAGTQPNPNVWSHELGDGSLNGIPGWGNAEFEYYTNDPANASTDGAGHLVITLDELPADTDLVCYYGPCRYTSARLISLNKAEFEYGRIEARIKVPSGQSGLWPAFWALGTDIKQVGWPQTGEIDIMEYVSRIPNEIFGTLHGPGYSGGASFGAPYDFGVPVANDFHTFTVEWSPDEIHWTVDGISYHDAIPADVAPNEWVYNHPFFLLLNVAIGGNFGGSISPDLTFPQETLVDYVRVYQAANSAECFETTFVDNFTGWKEVTLPFSAFVRSATQPANAPNDGLGLDEVWGYKFALADGSAGSAMLDNVRLSTNPLAVDTITSDTVKSYQPIIWITVTVIAITFATYVIRKRKIE